MVELRQYTLWHGQRDVLIELFDREFIESQEAAGMEVSGQFRDLDRPERFVWMRGFPDMGRRHQALEAFYGGPIWKAHAAAANATMVDVDDVLLLRPVTPSTGFQPQPRRPGQGTDVPAATKRLPCRHQTRMTPGRTTSYWTWATSIATGRAG